MESGYYPTYLLSPQPVQAELARARSNSDAVPVYGAVHILGPSSVN